jgi:hypothetical protein
MNVNALIADNDIRGRDERFPNQVKHKAKSNPLHDTRSPKPDGLFLHAHQQSTSQALTSACNTLGKNDAFCE